MINSVIMYKDDTVVTVTSKISLGEEISYIESESGQVIKVMATSDIPMYHKVAVRNIKKGEDVIKYGERIGYAIDNINPGDHVHTNNLDS